VTDEELKKEYERLKQVNEGLRMALSFYANPLNWGKKVILMPENREYYVDTGTVCHNDQGIVARNALKD